jgi:hypothetical protein
LIKSRNCFNDAISEDWQLKKAFDFEELVGTGKERSGSSSTI